jgi:hypothetical protein
MPCMCLLAVPYISTHGLLPCVIAAVTVACDVYVGDCICIYVLIYVHHYQSVDSVLPLIMRFVVVECTVLSHSYPVFILQSNAVTLH